MSLGSNIGKVRFLRNLEGMVLLTLIHCACSAAPVVVSPVPANAIQESAPPTTPPSVTPTKQPTITPTIIPTIRPTLVPTVTETEFSTPTQTPTVTLIPGAIPWQQAGEHAGEQATVCGPVVEAIFAEQSNGQPTFLNVGLPYPDPGRFTVLIWGDQRGQFSEPPELLYLERNICVTGTIELYQGSAEVIVGEQGQIVLYP